MLCSSVHPDDLNSLLGMETGGGVAIGVEEAMGMKSPESGSRGHEGSPWLSYTGGGSSVQKSRLFLRQFNFLLCCLDRILRKIKLGQRSAMPRNIRMSMIVY